MLLLRSVRAIILLSCEIYASCSIEFPARSPAVRLAKMATQCIAKNFDSMLRALRTILTKNGVGAWTLLRLEPRFESEDASSDAVKFFLIK